MRWRYAINQPRGRLRVDASVSVAAADLDGLVFEVLKGARDGRLMRVDELPRRMLVRDRKQDAYRVSCL